MKQIIGEMKKHPILSFFMLTLAMMYLIGFPIVYMIGLTGSSTDQPLLNLLLAYAGELAVYSPVLVGMFVTRQTIPDKSPASTRNRRLAFWIVWLIGLFVYALDLKVGPTGEVLGWIPLLIISTPVAFLPAFVVSSVFSRVNSLREYLSTLIHPRGNVLWYLVALLTFPVAMFLGMAITQLVTGRSMFSDIHIPPGLLLAALAAFARVVFYTGGINEEGGWRGFAQRRLQTSYSPLVANLLLGAFIILWHFPNDILNPPGGSMSSYLTIRLGVYPFIVILFGWVYNRTRGSLLAPVLFHASMNMMDVFGSVGDVFTDAGNILLVLFAVFAILMDRMWRKLPSDHLAAYHEPGSPSIQDGQTISVVAARGQLS
jgi:membrane protease YdiL (CAAX protease family)